MSVQTLTAMERQVYTELVEGLTNKEIAGKLRRNVNTVCQHVKSILRKLGCPSRTKLIAWHYKGLL